MKKILAILMILVLVGGVAFAQLTPQVTAKASVNWGIDFGAGKNAKAQHGFENLLDAKVVIPLYMGTLNSKTEGDVRMNFDLGVNLAYRFYNQLSNSASPHLAWDSDAEFDKLWRKTLSDMSASIHFFGGYMNVYGRPDFSTNYAQIWSPIRDNGVAWGPETSGDITGFGTKLGYASDDLAGTGLKFDAGLKFGSNGSWKAKGSTSQANKYAFGLDLSLGYDKWVTLDFGINATFDNVKDFGKAGVHEDVAAGSNPDKPYLGMGLKLGSKPVDGLALTLAMDALMNVGTDSKVAFDLRFDASYKWVALGAYFGNDLSAYAGKDKNNKAIGDMAAMIAFKSAASGDTNFVEGLAFGVDFRLNHLLSAVPTGDKSTLPMGISAWVNYKYALTDSMWVKPYANFWGETNRKSIDASKTDKFFGVAYKVGATFSPAEKIEIDTYWSQGKLSWNKYEGTEGMISAPAFDAHNGTFVIGVKVIY